MTPADRRKLAAALTEATGFEWSEATRYMWEIGVAGRDMLLERVGTEQTATLYRMSGSDLVIPCGGRGWHARLAADVAARLRGEE